MLSMKSKKSFIAFATLVLKNTNIKQYSSLFHTLNACARNFWVWIQTTNNNVRNFVFCNQITAWWRFAKMRTWFEADIHGGLAQKRFISNGVYGIYLSMSATKSTCKTFGNYAIIDNNHSPNRRIWHGCWQAIFSDINAALHIFLMVCHGRKSTENIYKNFYNQFKNASEYFIYNQ